MPKSHKAISVGAASHRKCPTNDIPQIMAQFARAVTREAIFSQRAEFGISCTAVWARLAYLDS
jgi:hypothetical protein